MLDRIAAGIRKKLGADLTLPQVLEAATWKGVRTVPRLLCFRYGAQFNIEHERALAN